MCHERAPTVTSDYKPGADATGLRQVSSGRHHPDGCPPAIATDGGNMRRIILVGSVIGMLLSATAPASAGSLKVRTDPNDSRSVLDIRKVITNLTARRMRLQVATGTAYDIWDVPRGMGYAISLDTVGNRDRGRPGRAPPQW